MFAHRCCKGGDQAITLRCSRSLISLSHLLFQKLSFLLCRARAIIIIIITPGRKHLSSNFESCRFPETTYVALRRPLQLQGKSGVLLFLLNHQIKRLRFANGWAAYLAAWHPAPNTWHPTLGLQAGPSSQQPAPGTWAALEEMWASRRRRRFPAGGRCILARADHHLKKKDKSVHGAQMRPWVPTVIPRHKKKITPQRYLRS